MRHILVLFFISSLSVSQVLAQQYQLPTLFAKRLQQQFQGRIIGINPHASCQTFTQDIVIGGQSHKAEGLSCQNANGEWTRDKIFDVQLLKQNQSVIILTVNVNQRSILNVTE